MKYFTHKMTAFFGALLMALSTVVALSSPAAADGVGCRWSHGAAGNTCLRTVGTGARVESVRVAHTDGGQFTNYCGFHSRTSGTMTLGTRFTYSSAKTSGCTIAPFYNDITVAKWLKLGTNITGQSYHDGAWAPGVPAVAIQ